MTSPLERLRARRLEVGAPLCLGIDPHPEHLPRDLPPTVAGMEAFARGLIEAAAPHAVAIKIQVAFFEALGAAGWAALERVRGDVPPDLLCILDAKRGDIDTTAERYAAGLLGHLDADAVTLSPYLGEDAITPFLQYPDRLVYVLARTSNPSAARVQGLSVDGDALFLRVARWAAETWTDGRVGLVVGATAPKELAQIRSSVPGPAFLVPGVGAQGGDLAASVAACDGGWAPGVVSISRGIAAASLGADWRESAERAAWGFRNRMQEAVLHSKAILAQRPITEAQG
ncbi:MAG: orotidine-5'-phosphate decarboxylase [Chloroflexota bacterium]|nr:orotidine-5'-phosphate decarboxylase [Chloroflexota bacterium]